MFCRALPPLISDVTSLSGTYHDMSAATTLDGSTDLAAVRVETRAWLEANCPAEMRQPMASEDDVCWGSRHFEFQSAAQRQWLRVMVARARTGGRVIFAAGTPEDVASAAPVLDAMGTVRMTGQRLGDGQSIKVVNQHLCSVHIAAAAEALSLARSLGLDPAAVLDLIEKGAAGSWMLSDRGPRMVAGYRREAWK